MKRTITTAALALSALAAAAQDYGESSAVRIDEAGRIHRTEVIPYDTRRDAEARNREAGGYYRWPRPATWPYRAQPSTFPTPGPTG